MQFLIECYMATFIQLEKITDTVAIRLSNAPGYHRQASEWQEPRLLDELVPVAIDEVVKLVRLLPSKSSPEDFMPTTMLKSSVDVMAPLIARLANMSFNSGGCSLHHWSTFDTIDHYILLDRISSDFGICGSTLGWLQSFVTGRYKYIAVGAQKSGIPQGSVLDPLLFAMYISPISNVVTAHSLDHHQTLTSCSCTFPFHPALMSLSQQSRSVLKTSLAGSLRTGCFSTEPRRRQFCSGLRPSTMRHHLRAAFFFFSYACHKP